MSSVGSWRSFRSSPSAMVQESRRKRTTPGGSAQTAGRPARSSDVTVLTSLFALISECGPREVTECVIEGLAGSGLRGQLGRSAQGHELAEMHDADASAQLGGLVHV